MIKFIDKLEKSTSFWILLGSSLLFFCLRLPSIIEPNWYGDEGIYQVIGRILSQGGLLYVAVWDNKPPLLYIIYAFVHGDHFAIRTLSLILGLASVWIFFFISRSFFSKVTARLFATLLFVFLFAMPLLEGNIANAENFIMFPVLIALLLLIKIIQKKQPYLFKTFDFVIPEKEKTQLSQRIKKRNLQFFSIGLLLGLAFLIKIVAIFDLAAFIFFFFCLVFQPKRQAIFLFLKDVSWILLGFLLPLVLTFLYFALHQAVIPFMQAAFLGNVGYVGYGNKLIIPQGLLLIKLLLLASTMLVIFLNRKKLTIAELFIFIWFSFSLFNTFFSQRPYTHYLLNTLPSFCLLFGLLFDEKNNYKKIISAGLLIFSVIIINNSFHPNTKKILPYYQNTYQFLMGQKDVVSYQSFFDSQTPRDYALASFLKMHTQPNDKIFIWGNSAQIYTLSDTLPINKYTVAYHQLDKKQVAETQKILDKIKPQYVIILNDNISFPFSLKEYHTAFSLEGVLIYEKND